MRQTYKLDPTSPFDLVLCLYKNVKNAPILLQKVRGGSLSCALVNPRTVYDPFQVVVAANQASMSFKADTMTTRSIHSEIVYCLSPNKNVSKSLTTFGMGKNDEEVLVAILQKKNCPSSHEEILSQIEGEMSEINLYKFASIAEVKKFYNVQNDNILEKIITMCAVKN